MIRYKKITLLFSKYFLDFLNKYKKKIKIEINPKIPYSLRIPR